MERINREHRATQPYIWIKGDDGNSYLCPKQLADDSGNVDGSLLRECVDESFNPQNN